MNELSIGIDFGTTKTLVSFYNETSGKPELIRLGRGRDYLPTSVYVPEEGGFLFGEDADDQIEFGVDRYCRAFKMKLGSNVPALAFLDGDRFIQHSAKELTRRFLQHIKERSENEVFMGKIITKAVITKPVLFSPAQCEELKEAALGAGFHEVEFVTEPEAAGYAFCTLCPSEAFQGNALVIDWGGGTLDMALVSRNGDHVLTHREYTAGDMNMGGEVFDEQLWNHVNRRLRDQGESDLTREKPEHQNLLFRKVREAKEMLSTQMQRTLRLSSPRGACPPISLERSEFEDLIRSHVEQAAGMARQLMNSIQGKALKPEILLFVGGTSKIPAISAIMEQTTGLPCRPWHLSQAAVSLGAGLFAVRKKERFRNSANDTPDTGDDSSFSKRRPHQLNVEAWEMASGCVKTADIQGKQFDIRIPPGVTAGTRLRLPASKTEGLGDIELEVVLQNSEGAKEKPLYREGLEYLHGINGHQINYREAANCFTRGYEQGDLNAAYMLCWCYQQGTGVPIDSVFALRLAEFLIERRYFPAYLHLSEAWGTGRGVPMDQQKAKEFSDKLESTCSQPIEGIDEVLRFDSLIHNELLKENSDSREMERLARHNFTISNLPTRFGLLAVALLKDVEGSPSARGEIRKLLDEGCKQGDLLSFLFKGSLLCGEDHSIFAPDKDKGISLLRKAVSHGEPAALFRYFEELDNEALCKQVLNRFWNVCRLGPSCIHGDKELNCSIRLEPCPFACGWRVYEGSITGPLLEQERLDQLVTQFPPQLILKNRNSHALHNLKVRICCRDKQLDRTIEIPSSLSREEELEINPLDYDLELGENLYVEVHSGDRCSIMDLGNIGGTSAFMHGAVPPLAMWWERGFLGGFILKLACWDGCITNVIVHKTGIVNTRPICLQAGQQPESVGWMEFSDSQSLHENEIFWIESAEYPPVMGRILTTPDDSGSAGWKSAAKVVGGSLLGILAAGS
ncbi:Hsp70 family protein [Akkermansia massiliensis]